MKKMLCCALLAAALVACATATPRQKLGNAFQLLQENRPIPAEPLMLQAIDEFKAQGNFYELGLAQFMYGQFVRSNHFTWQFFRKYYPDTDTQEQRNAMARTYFLAARESFDKALSNTTLPQDERTGYLWRQYLVNVELGDRPATCASVRAMKASDDAFRAANPSAKTHVQPPYKTFEEFIEAAYSQADCGNAK